MRQQQVSGLDFSVHAGRSPDVRRLPDAPSDIEGKFAAKNVAACSAPIRRERPHDSASLSLHTEKREDAFKVVVAVILNLDSASFFLMMNSYMRG